VSLYIFQLNTEYAPAQIAIRPGSIERVKSHVGSNGEDYAEIIFRVGRDGEQSAIVKHSVQEIVDAVSKNESFF